MFYANRYRRLIRFMGFPIVIAIFAPHQKSQPGKARRSEVYSVDSLTIGTENASRLSSKFSSYVNGFEMRFMFLMNLLFRSSVSCFDYTNNLGTKNPP
ncbi:hypothetical protein CEXT_593161 [Caerostris extrusa]|uniref:Secreted protein n=1 Tax=Caerostris extrusa TaxID=172846 RepID=A0AAV4P7T7_CAEEX|nr:hypothetical protein CEXT_593161 [Caerostris extrusa]